MGATPDANNPAPDRPYSLTAEDHARHQELHDQIKLSWECWKDKPL